jgi:hypothetical protein
MKTFTALAALVLLAGCTIQIGGKTTAGRVIISAGTPTHHTVSHSVAHSAAAHLMSKSLIHGKPHHARAVSSRLARARDLSAANDIASMSYTLINTDTNAVVDSKSIDPGYPFVDLFLTPGGNYRIVVDVAIKPTAPGTNVGVTRYGDQADFTVDLYYDTYVDLSVHPTNALVIDPASPQLSPSSVNVFDPSDSSTTSWKFFSPVTPSGIVVGASDKFFYGPDASLYYFNKAKNTVYKWKKIWNTAGDKSASSQTPMTSADKYIDGTDLGTDAGAGGDITIVAACADPWDATSMWLLGTDPSGQWNYYAVSINQTDHSQDVLWDTVSGGIDGAFIDDSNDTITDLTVMTPTAIAVDSTWGDVYVTYYSKSSNTSNVYSGVLQFYGDSLFAYHSGQVDGTPTQPILTDVAWDQGKAWVLGSPTTNLTGSGPLLANSGAAVLWTYDDFLSPLTSYPGLQKVYSGAISVLSSATSQLTLPNRFTGPIQATTLYISQADFTQTDFGSVSNTLGHALSSVNLTTNTVASH